MARLQIPQPPYPNSFWNDDSAQPEPTTEIINTLLKDTIQSVNPIKVRNFNQQDLVTANNVFNKVNKSYIEELQNQLPASPTIPVSVEKIPILTNKIQSTIDDYVQADFDVIDDIDEFTNYGESLFVPNDSSVTIKNSSSLTTLINDQPNKLDSYVNYTYNLSLYALDPSAFNLLMENSNNINNITKHLLISSGGIKKGRNPLFSDDFYIDDLEIDSIAPTTQKTRNTLNVNIKFKIVEPHGMSLIERLIGVAQDLIKIDPKQYTQIPYLIKISFMGYDSNGQPKKIENVDKHLLIKIWQIRFDVNAGGSTYEVQAIPFNHQAFDANIESIPMDLEISGNTVAGVLDKVVGTKITTERSDDEEFGGDLYEVHKTTTKSLVDLLNDRQKSISENKDSSKNNTSSPSQTSSSSTAQKRYPDVYHIEFVGDEIKNAKLNYKNLNPDNIITPKDKTDTSNFYRNFKQSVNKKFNIINGNEVGIKINSGTSLVEVIGILLLHSTYIHDQFKNNPKEERFETLKWFKITPKIKIRNEWDDVLGRYAYDITYYIKPYAVNNVTLQSKKYSVPRGKIQGTGYHKSYKYMYTGENDHILNFDIKYNLAYQTVSSAVTHTGSDNSPARGVSSTGCINVPHRNSQIERRRASIIDNRNQAGKGNLARDLADNVLTNGVDLFNLNLEIIGDPDFVMQNDLYSYEHILNDQLNTAFLQNGSVNYDYSEILIKLIFQTPVDYGQNGLMNFNSSTPYNTSTIFGGIYHIWKVKSTFADGQFKQSLSGIRLIDDCSGQEKTSNREEKNNTINSKVNIDDNFEEFE